MPAKVFKEEPILQISGPSYMGYYYNVIFAINRPMQFSGFMKANLT